MSQEPSDEIAPSELARFVASVVAPTVVDLERLHMRMQSSLVSHIRGITGESERDVESIWGERDGTSLIYAGFASGVARMLSSVDVDLARRSASVTLRATKGSVGVDTIDWGDVGPHVGNSLLVARLLDIGIQNLRTEGIVQVTNEPWDPRLRAHYQLMGFEQGERLALDDEAALARAFGYIERSYRRFGLRLRKL